MRKCSNFMRCFGLVGVTVIVAGLAATASASPLMYINDNNDNIGTVDLGSRAVTVLGNTNSGQQTLGDIAFDDHGNLYGVNINSQFFSLSTTTGKATLISTLSPSLYFNSLVGNPGGTLYAAARNSNDLFSISTTGVATDLGTIGFEAAGDLALVNGTLYEAALDPNGGPYNVLVRIPLGGNYTGTEVGSFEVPNVYGLGSDGSGTLYAVSNTQIYTVNLSTAAVTPLFDYGGSGLVSASGEAFVTESAVPEPASLAILALVPIALSRRRSPRK